MFVIESDGELIREDRVFFFLDAFYVSLLSEKYKGGKIPVVQGFVRGFVTWIKSLSNTDLSSSVIYFLRKD